MVDVKLLWQPEHDVDGLSFGSVISCYMELDVL